MSPIRDLAAQQRGREIGRIRLGHQVPAAKGTRPEKLAAFRLTTGSERVAVAVAAALGGQARPWTGAPTPGQWEVLTDASELAVAVPPGEAVISQWYELWSAGGCARRCDGITETITRGPCLCPPAGMDRVAAAGEGKACKPTTRLNVILPDLPDLGVWRVESHGYYALVELAGAAELLGAARAAGVIVPAVLRLEARQSKRGGQTRNYGVPVLEILPTLRELAALRPGDLAGALEYSQARALGPAGGPARVAAAPAPPPGPGDAQECADAARAATTRAQLTELGKLAAARDWLQVHVSDDHDVHEELRDVFFACAERFDAPPPPPDAGDQPFAIL